MVQDSQPFVSLPEALRSQVQAATQKYPETLDVFLSLCNHFEGTSNGSGSTKKRKLDNEGSTAVAIDILTLDEDAALKIAGVSVQTPVRKKLDLILHKDVLILRKPGTTSASSPPEYVINTKDIDNAYLLPIPEKAKPQWALIINPLKNPATNQNKFEITMVTITEDNLKLVVKPNTGELYNGNIQEILILYFQRQSISITSEATMPPNHSLICVSSHRGSKDGHLYFLPDCIFFGFKKPLLLFRLPKVLSVSYSSITKSTFNMTIKYMENLENEASGATNGGDAKSYQVEFSMIDQDNFDTINRYVESHRLNDESLAEERRAKVDAKAVFPDELIKASRESRTQDDDELPASKPSNGTKEPASSKKKSEVNFSTQDFDSDDDEEDVDFEEEEEDDDDDEEED